MPSVKSGPDYSRITEKGILGVFRQELEDQLGAGWSTDIAMRVKSDQETETYRWLGMTPALREWVNGRRLKGLRVEQFQITNKTYEATLEIPLDDLRRAKSDILRVRIADLARRGAEHWEKLLSSLIEANGTCYDGQNFFSASHSSGSSGTLTNLLTSADVSALDIAAAAEPTRDEFVAAITGVIQHLYGFKDDQGEPMNGGARSFMVMVPTNMYGAAVSAVTDRLLLAGAGNALINQRFEVDVVVNPRLTSDTVWYVFRKDSAAKPFILQSEMDLTASVVGAGSEQEFMHRRWLLGTEAIRNVGYGLWQHAAHCTFS